MSNPHNLQVGQKLYFPGSKFARERELTITWIGRIWATTERDRERLNLETLYIDGGAYSSPGRVWLSKAEWDAYANVQLAWNNLHARLRQQGYHCPEGMTLQAIDQIERLIFHPKAQQG